MCGSSSEVTGAGGSTCAGGGDRRRRGIRPNTVTYHDPVSWGASREVREVVGARNRRMVHLVARSTSGGGWPKSGEGDPTSLVR
jgi:hypothetical protein